MKNNKIGNFWLRNKESDNFVSQHCVFILCDVWILEILFFLCVYVWYVVYYAFFCHRKLWTPWLFCEWDFVQDYSIMNPKKWLSWNVPMKGKKKKTNPGKKGGSKLFSWYLSHLFLFLHKTLAVCFTAISKQ